MTDGWPEVWIVDPLRKMSESVVPELSRRQIAARRVFRAEDIAIRPPPPAGAFFCGDDPISCLVLGYLSVQFPRPILWLSRGAPPLLADFWRGKTVTVKSLAAPPLAKLIAFQLRRARP